MPTLLFLLIVLIPFLEVQSAIVGSGWSFQRTGRGKIPRITWVLQLAVFGAWLFIFWSLGRAVPAVGDGYAYAGDPAGDFDSTGVSMAATHGYTRDSAGSRGLARECLERVGVIGISLMALLSGFASVSSPWHAFVSTRTSRRRPVTEADIVRRQAGLDATGEMLIDKKHRLRALQKKVAAAEVAMGSSGGGLVGKLVGSLRGLSGVGDAGEIKALQIEIEGLESMEVNLSSSLSMLRTKHAAEARAGTTAGRLLAIPTYVFSCYCIYRVLATSLTSLRRLYYPAASFASSDPINRFLGILARHWDPKLDQTAWARQISFLLSGVILAASANSVLQTFHIFAKWAPGLLYQAQANLALLIGQITATYVISAGLLLRSNLPKDVGSAVGHALESALEPAFVDRWFEGWFLLASVATSAAIWVGRKISGAGEGWDELDELGGEEVGQKRS